MDCRITPFSPNLLILDCILTPYEYTCVPNQDNKQNTGGCFAQPLLKEGIMKALTVSLSILLLSALGCSDGSKKSEDTPPVTAPTPTSSDYAIELTYIHGNTINTNIYVIWIEDKTTGYIQNLAICNRVLGIGKTLTNTALPYWNFNKRPKSNPDELSEVSDITCATKANQDFTVTGTLPKGAPSSFSVFVEADRSFDANDWFDDQPAILYSAPVDLNSGTTEYELTFYGWTPNEGTKDAIPLITPGTLVDILGYINNLKDSGPSGFGAEDTTRKATNMVKKITVKFTAK